MPTHTPALDLACAWPRKAPEFREFQLMQRAAAAYDAGNKYKRQGCRTGDHMRKVT